MKPLILVTNDDGVNAPGIAALVEMVRPLGRVIVVAPEEGNSGMSHAITIKVPLRLTKVKEEEGLVIYSCSGTPADCVKLAMSEVVKEKPALLVSGINHGSNSAVSIVYSGTMAAAMEGSLYGIPSVGFSLLDYSYDADFSAAVIHGRPIAARVLEEGLVRGGCLNVNFPVLPSDMIKGVKVCRMSAGSWREEFEKRIDPRGHEYFWLTGSYHNAEPASTDTDEWALTNGYISIVPINMDYTNYQEMEKMKNWELISNKNEATI
ncbi:5'/3'-nucleotidase SurE [Williamwhitmania taraxaci]|uniref:5'-nucleotidase SurE n=1 Tax=Williamwhitmania taraxaci TaxID=1640674 RepID=A0A1G6LJV8_9BACT|nr:5'/3'-nucleotidase SurE [Williamwhitmania taraxaci]SDC43493.1 5'-nucleotidase /3'-nucleotidase /exopolyphosphatase [Williamwhitmania taraxaci]